MPLCCSDGKIHIIGAFPLSNSHQIYDPKTDTWSIGTPVIAGYYYAVAAVTTGEYAPKQIHVFGINSQYWDLGLPEFSTQSYDPTTDNWTLGTHMNSGRINAGVTVVNDTIYVIGGSSLMIGNNIFSSAINEHYTPQNYVPEFSSWLILPFLVSLAAVAYCYKKKLTKTPNWH